MMYSNGVINTTLWPTGNDYSFPTSSDNYTDTTHPQAGHTYDLSETGSFAGWQQATNWAVTPFGLNISAYTKLQFDVYFPSGGAQMLFHYTRSGGDDIPIAASVSNIADYFGTLGSGSWHTSLQMPLALLGALGQKAYYKFTIQTTASALYLDNVQFVPGNLSWMYNGGTAPFTGWADASVNASANYSFSPSTLNAGVFFALNDVLTIGNAVSTVNVIKLTTSALHGKWEVTNSGGFSLAPYSYVTVGLLPTIAGYSYTMQFYNTSGVAVGNAVNPSSYIIEDPGVQSTPSRWAVYYVPLSAFGSLPSTIGGFSIADASSQTSNVIYLTAPGFVQ
jgi:hypothetical protein